MAVAIRDPIRSRVNISDALSERLKENRLKENRRMY